MLPTLKSDRIQCPILVFTLQLRQLNTSVKSLLTSMENAPYMKSLPGDVKEVQQDVAKFGSRMTEMEAQLVTLGLRNEERLTSAEVLKAYKKKILLHASGKGGGKIENYTNAYVQVIVYSFVYHLSSHTVIHLDSFYIMLI